uniref:Ig-like domain-containing protein n=1 Tax=Monopterus albus TaxID=43700 RepID=A0A3Q3ITE4_MONAL
INRPLSEYLCAQDLKQPFPGQWQPGPPQPVVVMVGDEAALPCQLEPPVDAVHMTVEWGRPDLNPRFVYVWHDGQELLVDQNPAYKGRVSLSTDKLKQGDISLKLSTVKISDNGTYRCYVPKQSKEYFVELLVAAVSSPGASLAGLDRTSSGVVLQCESRGWYPEPELLWLDTEGNLLPAGPTETVPGPDGLYTVSGRATVEQRHGSSFTCRVQQSNTNQSRETHIQVQNFIIKSKDQIPVGLLKNCVQCLSMYCYNLLIFKFLIKLNISVKQFLF